MALPYAAAAYLFVRAARDRVNQSRTAIAGGILAGVAFQINPKGIFDLIFFAVLLFAWRRWAANYPNNVDDTGPTGVESKTSVPQTELRLVALATVGLVASSLPFLVYIGATRSLREYWSYVWDWGARYGSYNPLSRVFVAGLTRSIDYFTLNNTLLIALVFVCVVTFRRARRTDKIGDTQASPSDPVDHSAFLSDLTLLLWLAVSYAGVLLGGRLYSHYFFQILPSLCLIGARGLTEIKSTLKSRDEALRTGITVILVLGFVFTLVRFHGRTAVLAADLVRGRKSEMTTGWFHERIDREEREVAAAVRELPEGEDSGQDGLEMLRAGGPRMREVDGPTDFLFVWGYRPEIYYISGLLPASRFLSTQPLTGVPADVHYFPDDDRPVLNETSTSLAREQLIRDLQETRPKYIVDELGMFNAELSINSYPELREFMKEYKATGAVARFMIYCRRELLEKNLRRIREKQQ
jgi:hypothetical protein